MTTNNSMKKREECAKYGYDTTLNIKLSKICAHCHGNKVSLVSSYSMSWISAGTTVSDFGFLPFQLTP